MMSFCQAQKWSRWSRQKVDRFLRIITLFWTPKLKVEVNNFLFNMDEQIPHLESRKVKEASALLGVPEEESKSLQIKFIRVVKSFPRKYDLALRFSEIIVLKEKNPTVNFFSPSPDCEEAIQQLHRQFDKLITEMSILICPKDTFQRKPASPLPDGKIKFQISNDFLYSQGIPPTKPQHRIRKHENSLIKGLPGMKIVSVWGKTFLVPKKSFNLNKLRNNNVPSKGICPTDNINLLVNGEDTDFQTKPLENIETLTLGYENKSECNFNSPKGL